MSAGANAGANACKLNIRSYTYVILHQPKSLEVIAPLNAYFRASAGASVGVNACKLNIRYNYIMQHRPKSSEVISPLEAYFRVSRA